jgi:DNA-binding response OmpR family regulator
MTTEVELPLNKRILLVDDERGVREVVRLLLAHDRHEVVEANNGAEAFGLFATGKFDLVLTDCHMPFVQGDELAARIRSVAPEQPILMITSHGYCPGRGNPVDMVLDKPFNLDGLRVALATCMNQAQLRSHEEVSGTDAAN